MCNHDDAPKVPIKDCIPGRVYRIRSRNLSFGVYDGKEGFIGIRQKFGDRYLFTEYHWDQGEPFGTVYSQLDLGIDVPDNIPLAESLETIDKKTQRPVCFDKPVADGGRGWFFLDTNEASELIRPVSVSNKELFEFLERIETHCRAALR